MSEIIPKKKRGRKPKNFNSIIVKKEISDDEENIKTDDGKIILHLPITMNEINNDTADISMFITSEKDLKKIEAKSKQKVKDTEKEKTSEDPDSTESLKSSAKYLINNTFNKIQTYSLNFKKHTKCWWCRHSFTSPPVELPEDYYNETFYCIGHFCSYNCMKSYNLDINDSLTSKRESLMNLMYYLTYKKYPEIINAPNWMTLEDYGGTLTIEEFRKNSIINSKEYVVLHPPLISRQMQIEESYKMNKLKQVPIDKLNRMYSEMDSEYTIKRSKPVQTNQLNLETTMGLVKSKKH
jgi:hypothetical protein